MKLYDQAEECELKVNDVVEVFGVFELDLEPEGVVPPGADNMQAMVAMLIPSAVGGLTLKPVKDSLQQVTTAVHAPDCARATAS